ncbi:hypothetical protein IH601_07710 [Candidatus Bipolaricaulota bacterium]|nr:hypothetical protein [Candidatus Bipolaricaulota bacterium]TFH08824.1 MAG: hypothetical protein E4H08_07055 [Candidatus Atribacteria bacterium]
MKRKTAVALGSVVAIVIAVAAIVLWPAPDPLKNARTVYLDTGRAQATGGSAELEDGLGFVLNDRNLVLVANRAEADAEIRVQDISVNLGDVTVSLGQGGISGNVKATCAVTDLQSSRTYTMDLTVTLANGAVTAKLVGRKFWEVWK